MAKKPNRLKTPAKPAKAFRWWQLAAVVFMIVALFFLLEKLKGKYRNEKAVESSVVEVPAIQSRREYQQKPYSTARTTPAIKSVRPQVRHQPGTVAVIVDDMGSSLNEVRELLSINMPLTFSIIPGLPKVKGVAEAAASAGREVMVHLPMEPQGYPKQRLEANGLLVAMSAEEIAARTVELLNAVPHATGANNHMGSRFTEQEEKMEPVLKVLKGRGLFFVDSRTSPRSTGYAGSIRLGIKTASRDVFLDNEQDVAAIKKQLFVAADISRKKGGVIAICHPHAATIAALKEAMPELQRSGITFVSAGELVR